MAKRRNRKRSGGIAREDYTKGGRVGYREGNEILVDPRTGEPIIKGNPLQNQDRINQDEESVGIMRRIVDWFKKKLYRDKAFALKDEIDEFVEEDYN